MRSYSSPLLLPTCRTVNRQRCNLTRMSLSHDPHERAQYARLDPKRDRKGRVRGYRPPQYGIASIGLSGNFEL